MIWLIFTTFRIPGNHRTPADSHQHLDIEANREILQCNSYRADTWRGSNIMATD